MRQRESKAALAAVAPRIAELVARTRSIKATVETVLSGLFAGRAVNVLGEINNVLRQ